MKQERGKIKYIQKGSIPALLSDLCIDDLTARRLQNDHLAIGGEQHPSSEAIIREGDNAVKLLSGLLFLKPKLSVSLLIGVNPNTFYWHFRVTS